MPTSLTGSIVLVFLSRDSAWERFLDESEFFEGVINDWKRDAAHHQDVDGENETEEDADGADKEEEDEDDDDDGDDDKNDKDHVPGDN